MIQVSQSTLLPAMTMKSVGDPNQADLKLVDEFDDGDMKVYKSISALGTQTIMVSEAAVLPDVLKSFGMPPVIGLLRYKS